MVQKRMRIFAGPNGSGKTTILKSLQAEIPFGIYVNADDIEVLLKQNQKLLFNSYQLLVTQQEIELFFQQSQFAPIKRNEPELWQKLRIEENVLSVETEIDSYLAADLADFIRNNLLKNGISFSYETVLSHDSKIDFIVKAKENGYRVYLYYIATEDPEINISRVNIRVAQHGHSVPPNTIKTRYYKSLGLLRKAVINSHRAYLWDNSGSTSSLFAEITDGRQVEIIEPDKVPNWFIKYLVNAHLS